MHGKTILDTRDSAFCLRERMQGDHVLDLLVQPRGSHAEPVVIWSCGFADDDGRDALLNAVNGGELDITFLGRLTMMFGGAALDDLAKARVAAAVAERAEALEAEAKRARDRLIVNLYAREGKYGRHLLELQAVAVGSDGLRPPRTSESGSGELRASVSSLCRVPWPCALSFSHWPS